MIQNVIKMKNMPDKESNRFLIVFRLIFFPKFLKTIKQ